MNGIIPHALFIMWTFILMYPLEGAGDCPFWWLHGIASVNMWQPACLPPEDSSTLGLSRRWLLWTLEPLATGGSTCVSTGYRARSRTVVMVGVHVLFLQILPVGKLTDLISFSTNTGLGVGSPSLRVLSNT